MSLMWKEIHGFTSPGEYTRFVRFLEDLVRAGRRGKCLSTRSMAMERSTEDAGFRMRRATRSGA